MTTTDLPPTDDSPTDEQSRGRDRRAETPLADESAADQPRSAPVIDGESGSSPDVDPRMRERWLEARRAEGRRRLRVLVVVLVAMSLVGIGYLVAHSPLLGVDTVSVRGAATVTAAEVRRAARLDDGAPLLFLDTRAVARRIEAIPAVDTAVVVTELPTTVVITITERHPVGFVRGAGPHPIAAVDGRGRVVSLGDQPPPGVPEVVGAGPVAPLGGSMVSAAPFRGLAALTPALRLATGRFTVRNGEGIARLVGTPPPARLIRFGPIRDIGPKAAAAVAVIDDLVRRGQHVRWLDVRVPTAPVTR